MAKNKKPHCCCGGIDCDECSIPESVTLSIPSPLATDIGSGGSQALTYGTYDFLDDSFAPFSVTGWMSPCILISEPPVAYQFLMECVGGSVLSLFVYFWSGTFDPDTDEFINGCDGRIQYQCFIGERILLSFVCNPLNAEFPSNVTANLWPDPTFSECLNAIFATNGTYNMIVTA